MLASASPARLRQLTMAGFAPDVIVSGVDEDGFDHLPTRETVMTLAERKTAAVAALPEASDAIVVGCDSLLELDGRSFGKPASAEEATRWWKNMRGRDGVLMTGHCVMDTRSGQSEVALAQAVVRFGSPSDDEIAAYVATGEPLRAAGAFTSRGYSGPFIDGVDGDPGAVTGISLPLFRSLLATFDLTVMDLWA